MMDDPEADAHEAPDTPSPEPAPARAPRYEWAESVDEERRAFVMEHFASAELDGNILISNMQRAFTWLKHGTMPQMPKRKLKVVDDGAAG